MNRVSRNLGMIWSAAKSWRGESYYSRQYGNAPMSRSFRQGQVSSNNRTQSDIRLDNGDRISGSSWNEKRWPNG
jgi:hypothetical protein